MGASGRVQNHPVCELSLRWIVTLAGSKFTNKRALTPRIFVGSARDV
jgi:hypothetical protein